MQDKPELGRALFPPLPYPFYPFAKLPSDDGKLAVELAHLQVMANVCETFYITIWPKFFPQQMRSAVCGQVKLNAALCVNSIVIQCTRPFLQRIHTVTSHIYIDDVVHT